MSFQGIKLDTTTCTCTHEKDYHTANPMSENEPKNCLARGCRCHKFTARFAERELPPQEADESKADAELDNRRSLNRRSHKDRFVRAVHFGQRRTA